MDYYAYHMRKANEFQRYANLHYRGAREFCRRGLTSTATLWQNLASHQAYCARRELKHALDEMKYNSVITTCP